MASRSLRFVGAARIAMRVTPRTPRNGHALRFNGTVRGAPAGGRVTIQVPTGRFWRTFLTPTPPGSRSRSAAASAASRA